MVWGDFFSLRANIEKTFMELMDLANFMYEEEQRYVREGFSSDEELSMYDMLFDENLSKEDIKKVAVDLLDKIKTKIAELDHWTDKQETMAEVDTLIGKICGKNCRRAILIRKFLSIASRYLNMCL